MPTMNVIVSLLCCRGSETLTRCLGVVNDLRKLNDFNDVVGRVVVRFVAMLAPTADSKSNLAHNQSLILAAPIVDPRTKVPAVAKAPVTES